MQESWQHLKAVNPIERDCGYPCRMAASDSNAILPVQVGTAIAILATVITGLIGFMGPILPGDLADSSSGVQVWWFGVGLFASLSGVLGLVFLKRRARKTGAHS